MALVITRRLRRGTPRSERRIYIGSDIVITLIEVDVNKVKLAIDAPLSVRILRQEAATPALAQEIEKAAGAAPL